MDTGKLLKIVEDIQHDETAFSLQSIFQNILDFYNQNNPDALNGKKSDLADVIQKTRLNNYVLTDFKILENLSIQTFFGEKSLTELNNILSSQAHEVSQKLTNFVSQRREALNKIESIKSSLGSFNILARKLDEENYEIGFSFPDEYQKLNELTGVLKDIETFLVSIASATSENKEFKISYVSNGTIEVFIQASQDLAHHFSLALDHALKIYECILLIEALKRGSESLSKNAKKAIDEIFNKDKDEKCAKHIEDLVQELKIENSEDKTRVGMLFKRMLKHFESGVSAEVKTPAIEAPREPTADDSADTKKELKELKKQYEAKKIMDSRNREIFKLQQNKFHGFNTEFLSGGLSNDSE